MKTASIEHPTRTGSLRRTMSRTWPRVALWSAVGAALALVSLAYLNPHLMLDLADRVWSCF